MGFFGKCLRHRNWVGGESDDDVEMSGAAMTDDMDELSTSRETCARTEVINSLLCVWLRCQWIKLSTLYICNHMLQWSG